MRTTEAAAHQSPKLLPPPSRRRRSPCTAHSRQRTAARHPAHRHPPNDEDGLRTSTTVRRRTRNLHLLQAEGRRLPPAPNLHLLQLGSSRNATRRRRSIPPVVTIVPRKLKTGVKVLRRPAIAARATTPGLAADTIAVQFATSTRTGAARHAWTLHDAVLSSLHRQDESRRRQRPCQSCE